MTALVNGTRHSSAAAGEVGVQTPLRQVWSPLHTSPVPQGPPSGALAHAFEQQSSSTRLPSSHSSLA
jgi:hypothetical protein